MKKLTVILIAAGVIAGVGTPVMAAGPAVNVAFVSDYVWRGDTQSDNKIAIQGGMDWEKDKLSLGIWGSSLGTTTPGAEVDFYGSYNLGAVSVGAIYYYYPSAATGTDFYELNVGGDVGPVALMASYKINSPSVYYIEAGYSMKLGEKAELALHVGQAEGATMDYSLGVSTSAAGLDFGLTYANKDVSTTFVSVSKSM